MKGSSTVSKDSNAVWSTSLYTLHTLQYTAIHCQYTDVWYTLPVHSSIAGSSGEGVCTVQPLEKFCTPWESCTPSANICTLWKSLKLVNSISSKSAIFFLSNHQIFLIFRLRRAIARLPLPGHAICIPLNIPHPRDFVLDPALHCSTLQYIACIIT